MSRAFSVLGDLASAVAVVLVIPFGIILIGLLVVLVVRLVMAVAAW